MNAPLPSPPPRRRVAVWATAVLVSVAVVVAVAWYFLRSPAEVAASAAALRRHDPDTAHRQLDDYLRRHPHDQRALLLGVQAARRCNAYADAERWLAAFEQQAGSTDASQVEWALLGVQQGESADKADWMRTVIEGGNTPEAIALLEALGKGYATTYQWMEAMSTLTRLLELSPDHVLALILRGTVAERLRRQESAETDYRRAVAVAPESAAAHAALAGHYQSRGYTREALRHYELALQLRPGDPEAQLGLARARIDAADPKAESLLDELLAAHPDHVEGLVERAKLELRRKRPERAEPYLNRAVERAPWHREAQRLRLTTIQELGRTADVPACEAKVAALVAEDGEAGWLKVKAHGNSADIASRWKMWEWSLRNGEETEGVVWLSEILRTAPRDAQAHTALAEHYDRVGQPRRAAWHRKSVSKP